ncbi:MAG: hypothetical protein IKS49_02905 [Actinomycetaceae bacterium]|nr:hypothetical protein [Actinomycetaceae bacterium]
MKMFFRYTKQLIRQHRLILIIGNESATASCILLLLAGIIALALLGKPRTLPLPPTLITTVTIALCGIPISWNYDKSPQHLGQLRYLGAKNSFFLAWGFTYSFIPAFVLSLFILIFAAPPFPFFILLGSTLFISLVSACIIALTEHISHTTMLNKGGFLHRFSIPFPTTRFRAYSFHLYKSGIILPYIVVFIFLSPALLYLARKLNQPYGLFIVFIALLCFDALASLTQYEQKRRPLLQSYYYRVTMKESWGAKTFLVLLTLVPFAVVTLVDIAVWRDINSSLAIAIVVYLACAVWAVSYFYTYQAQQKRLTSLYKNAISILAFVPLMPFVLAFYAHIQKRSLRRIYVDHF